MNEFRDRIIIGNFWVNFVVGVTLVIFGFLQTFEIPADGWVKIGIGLWLLFCDWSMCNLASDNEK